MPGAVRVAISRYAGDIEATAWKWPDGTLALVMLNQSEEIRPVCVRLNDQEADLILYPRSILSARIRES